MAVNYAAGLSPYENKGKLGLPEIFESEDSLFRKTEQLAKWISSSNHFVVHTGAGVSTSAGIPDFRGPRGVWTLEEKGSAPEFNISFDEAVPTFTHMALVTLEERGYLKYLITQNIDGLHLRSGFPKNRLSILHGDMFMEECISCHRRQVRQNTVQTVGRKFTGEHCQLQKPTNKRPCRGKLRDTILDWEDELPSPDIQLAEHHSKLADLSLTLGTTLQIVPAGTLPLFARKHPSGGKLVICNLQPTKHDRKADLVIHGKVDDVMRKVLGHLSLECVLYRGPALVQKSRNGSPERPTKQSRQNLQQKTIAKKRRRASSPVKSEVTDNGSIQTTTEHSASANVNSNGEGNCETIV